MQKEETQFYDLLGLYLSGDATREEHALLKELVAANEEYAKVFEVITKPVEHYQYHENVLEQAYAAHYVKNWLLANPAQQNAGDEKSAPRNIKKSKKRIYFYSATIAAIFLLIISFYFFQDTQQADKLLPQTVTTRKGDKLNLTLPDGTKVWLNADSRLSYDKTFSKKTREVILTGEAFFDVVHNRQRPFIVHTALMDVKVLGTAFNIKAYKGDANIQTTLIRGSVEVSLNNKPGKNILLSPNEKLVLKNEHVAKVLENSELAIPEVAILKIERSVTDSIVKETSWMANRLVFDQQTLQDIMPMLQRWYNVTIDIKTSNHNHRLYNGSFENDSLEDVLEALKTIGGFNYSIHKNDVTIY